MSIRFTFHPPYRFLIIELFLLEKFDFTSKGGIFRKLSTNDSYYCYVAT